MNKLKLSKILGVGLALVMVFSLMLGFMPAQKAQAADSAWSAVAIPSATGQVVRNGSNVTGLAVAANGTTIYAIDAQTAAPGAVLKSTNAGRSFAAVTNPLAAPYSPQLVAVSPDNPDAVAIVDNFAGVAGTNAQGRVFISNNGGITWAQLPVVPSVPGTLQVMAVAVGPARAGTLLGRDYAVACSDNATPGVVGGDINIIGAGAAWATVGGPGVGVYDYTSVAFAPNFLGDRCIVGVGSNAAGTALVMVNQNTGANIVGPTVITPTAFPIDYNAGVAANSIISSSIALPIDFDGTAAGGRRVWVGLNAAGASTNCDVYRIDNVTPRKLALATIINVNSLSYSGVIAGGTLFAGEVATTTVWYTNDPYASFPNWSQSAKGPTGTNLTILAVSPDYQTSKKVFAGTSSAADTDSALSLSYNGGVSFNQISLIDTTMSGLSDVMPTPDGKTVFLVSWDAAGATLSSLWKSSTPTNAASWDRVRVAFAGNAAVGSTIVRLNPDYATAPCVYWADAATINIQYSANGGDTFRAETTPATIVDMAVESGTVVYAIATANAGVYKSTNSGWFFGLPVNAGIANLATIAMAPSYPNLPIAGNVLVGGAGAAVAYSKDSAASFTAITGGLAGTTFVQVIADTGYATNNTIYAGSNTATQGIYRFVIGTSAAWDNILALPAGTVAVPLPGTQIWGLVAANKALYGATDTSNPGIAAPAQVMRSIGPTAPLGLVTFEAMNVGLAAQQFNAAPSSLRIDGTTTPILYAIDSVAAATLLNYTDTLATVVPVLTAPAAGTTIAIDPVSGRAELITLSWNAMGAGNGLVSDYEIDIANAGTSFAALVATTRYVPGGGVAPVLNGLDPTAPQLTVGATGVWGANLAGGKSYEWRVRARNEISGDAIRSGRSATGSFAIEASSGAISPEYSGPILQAPTPGAIGASLSPGFAWAPTSGAVKYEFELSKSAATTARGYFIDALVGLTGTNALVTPGWQCDKTLDYNTSYFWHVKGITATGTETIWGTAQFTTITAGVFTCPLDGLTFATQAELEAHNAVAHAPVIPQTPAYIWAVVIIGAILVIVVIALIFTTRRVS